MKVGLKMIMQLSTGKKLALHVNFICFLSKQAWI